MSDYAQNGITKFRQRMNAKKQEPLTASLPQKEKSKSPAVS